MSQNEWAIDLIEELKSIEGIIQVIVIEDAGRRIWKMSETKDMGRDLDLYNFISTIKDLMEMDLLFDNVRIFAKKIKDKFIIVYATHSAPIAYLRLKCENFIQQRPF